MDCGSEPWSSSLTASPAFKFEAIPNVDSSKNLADVIDCWKKTGLKLGLKTDLQIASFLLDRFEATNHLKQPTSCCVQCHSPLTLYCLKCQQPDYQDHVYTSLATGVTPPDTSPHNGTNISVKQESSPQEIVYITVQTQENSVRNAPHGHRKADGSGTQEEVIVIYDEKTNKHVVIESPFPLSDGNLDFENVQFSLEDSIGQESRRNLVQTCEAGLHQVPSTSNQAVLQQTVTTSGSNNSSLLTEPHSCSNSLSLAPQSGSNTSLLLAETRSSLLSTIKQAHNPSQDSRDASTTVLDSWQTKVSVANSVQGTKMSDSTVGGTENCDENTTPSVSHESSLSSFLEQILNAEAADSSNYKSVNASTSSAVSVSATGEGTREVSRKGVNLFSSAEPATHCSRKHGEAQWVNQTDGNLTNPISPTVPSTHSSGGNSGANWVNGTGGKRCTGQVEREKKVKDIDPLSPIPPSTQLSGGQYGAKRVTTWCCGDSDEANQTDRNTENGSSAVLPASGDGAVNGLGGSKDSNACDDVKEEKWTMSDSVYKCTACGLSFLWRVGLMQHKCANRGSKPYVCTYCAAAFSWKGALNVHMRVHTGQRPFVCGYCGHSFKDRTSLTRHTRIHTGVRPYVCQHCGFAFHQSGALKKHVLRCHTDNVQNPFVCELCGAAFPELGKLRAHVLRHTDHRPFLCKDCGKAFTQSSHLKRHMQARHLGEKPYVCGLCLMAFSQKDTLCMHRKTHTGGKPFLCEQCGASFKHRKRLVSHCQQHACVRTYNCQDCELSFFIKKNLLEHRRSCHPSKGPVTCPLCPAVFKNRGGQLRQHMQTHRGPQKYVCHFCKAVFFYARSLKKHIDMKHTPVVSKLPANVPVMMDKSTSTDVSHATRSYKTDVDVSDDIIIPVSADVSSGVPSSIVLPISVGFTVNVNDSSDITFSAAGDSIDSSSGNNVFQGVVDSCAAFKESSACSTAFFESSTETVNTIASETSVSSSSSFAVPVSTFRQSSSLVKHTPVSIVLPNSNTSTIILQHSSADGTLNFSDDSLAVAAAQSVSTVLEKVNSQSAVTASRSSKKLPRDPSKKPFICKHCGATFGQLRYLKRHEQRKHTEEKKFVCIECQAGFIGKSPLLAHMRVHTGEKPFVCPDCPMAFTHYIQLLRHNKRYHPKPADQKPVLTTAGGIQASQQLKQDSIS